MKQETFQKAGKFRRNAVFHTLKRNGGFVGADVKRGRGQRHRFVMRGALKARNQQPVKDENAEVMGRSDYNQSASQGGEPNEDMLDSSLGATQLGAAGLDYRPVMSGDQAKEFRRMNRRR